VRFFDGLSPIGAAPPDAHGGPWDGPYPHGGPWDPPEGVFPGAAASALLLARTDEVAVAVTAIWAFEAGFEFWVWAQFRHPGPALENEADEQSLHIGLQFADGRKAANVGRLPESAGSEAAGLIMSPRGFGGGLRQRNRRYWVWPLPPAGPLAFVCQWTAFGIPEKRTEVDAQLILDAAERSVQIWPQDNG
jgi:hypothetical protein